MPDLERLAGTVVGQVRSRLELLAVEWQEEKLRLSQLLLATLLVLFLVELAIVLAVMGLVVAFWDSPQRLIVIAVATTLCGGAAFISWRYLRGRLNDPHKPFAASIAELRRDEDTLQP